MGRVPLIVIGASAGGIELPGILARAGALDARHAADGDALEPGTLEDGASGL